MTAEISVHTKMRTQQDKHSPEPKRLLGSLLPGHCSAPAKRSENSTLGIGRMVLSLLSNSQETMGYYICAHVGDILHQRQSYRHLPDQVPLSKRGIAP